MDERTDPEHTQRVLTERLRDSIGRLRRDLEARSDPLLAEVVDVAELLLELTSRAHERAADNRRRIDAFEAGR